MMKTFIKNFLLCGAIGWCMECFWTGLTAISQHSNRKLICHTSVWMFPIYGMAAVFYPLSKMLKGVPILIRGAIYMVSIFGVEFVTGTILQKFNACPWDYSKARWNFNGVIRFDYAPVWFVAGLIFERVLLKLNKN